MYVLIILICLQIYFVKNVIKMYRKRRAVRVPCVLLYQGCVIMKNYLNSESNYFDTKIFAYILLIIRICIIIIVICFGMDFIVD